MLVHIYIAHIFDEELKITIHTSYMYGKKLLLLVCIDLIVLLT